MGHDFAIDGGGGLAALRRERDRCLRDRHAGRQDPRRTIASRPGIGVCVDIPRREVTKRPEKATVFVFLQPNHRAPDINRKVSGPARGQGPGVVGDVDRFDFDACFRAEAYIADFDPFEVQRGYLQCRALKALIREDRQRDPLSNRFAGENRACSRDRSHGQQNESDDRKLAHDDSLARL